MPIEYIGPSDFDAIFIERLRYLLDAHGLYGGYHHKCRECSVLAAVEDLLLSVFLDSGYPRLSEQEFLDTIRTAQGDKSGAVAVGSERRKPSSI